MTPYWSGREMMRIHLASIRQFYPEAPILISKRGDDRDELQEYRDTFKAQCWLEDCSYVQALLRLLQRCETEYVCVCDHDTVLLSDVDEIVAGIVAGRYDLAGFEELVRYPDRDDWLRFGPGYVDTNFMIFNLRQFLARWGLRGIKWNRTDGTWQDEYTYGISQKLKRHRYLQPFHTRKYGFGNLLSDGEKAVAWHQWYGAYANRARESAHLGASATDLEAGERAFLADYPNLDFSGLRAAWGPDCDVAQEQLRAACGNPCTGWRGFKARVARRWRAMRYQLR